MRLEVLRFQSNLVNLASFLNLPQTGEVKSGATGIAEFCPKREIERYQE